ncbi:NAD-dependent epimerase/dehydratase family protein [Sandarakinorhabdus sp.]|uniref:NAD-dependent epimerase/dehydratase family protein n=1 Tax=Sandarakinorhabdus sp. TaxID=1916663 RepID=UPI003F7310C8
MNGQTVLIIGASGVIGEAAVERFAADGYHVLAVSRRAPHVPPGTACEHIALDLLDASACQAAAPRFAGVTHVVYAALFEKPGLVAGWTEPDQMDTNLAMMRNLMEPLLASAQGLRHVSAFQGTKAYGAHLHPLSVPARESAPRDPHANFYWLQEDYLRAKRCGAAWTLTIWRPQIVFGLATGVAMNIIPVLGIYAAICRELGRPFVYPGLAGGIGEAVDTGLIASALAWAATAPQAGDETFNITNGDVFEWISVWPAIARAVGLEPAYGAPFSLAEFLLDHAGTWDSIVRRHGLQPHALAALLGESHHYADLLFGVMAPPETQRPPILVSTIKLRRAGFADCRDTEEMFERLLGQLAERKIIPSRP